MSNPVERSIIEYLMHPVLRDIGLGYMADYMFQTPRYALLVNILGQEHYKGLVPDPKSLVLDVYNEHKDDVSEEDLEVLSQIAIDAGHSYRELTKSELEQAIHHIEQFVKDRMIARGMDHIGTAGKDKSRARAGQELLQAALNFSISTDLFYDFSDPEFVKLAQENDFPPGGVIIKSHLSLINQSSTYKGYKFGDLIGYVAKPGVGKSTGMLDEGAYCIRQGFRTAHVCLGDMSEYDLFVMYLSYFAGVTRDEIITNGHEQYMTGEIKELFSRLRCRALPADTYDVYQLVSKINQLRRSFPFEMLIVDYDANIKGSRGVKMGGEADMYGEGGNTYANLKSYGKGRCVVIIGSQVKTGMWEMEILPMDCPAESSKKAHHLDTMITIGRNKIVPHLGTANIAKMRRGKAERQVRLHFDYAYARLREIPAAKYEEMKVAHGSRVDAAVEAAYFEPKSPELTEQVAQS